MLLQGTSRQVIGSTISGEHMEKGSHPQGSWSWKGTSFLHWAGPWTKVSCRALNKTSVNPHPGAGPSLSGLGSSDWLDHNSNKKLLPFLTLHEAYLPCLSTSHTVSLDSSEGVHTRKTGTLLKHLKLFNNFSFSICWLVKVNHVFFVFLNTSNLYF